MAEPVEYPTRHPGRRQSDLEPTKPLESLELRDDKNKILMYLLTGMVSLTIALIGYLCLESKKQGETLIRMDERSQAYAEQFKRFQAKDEELELRTNRLNLELQNIRIQAASHGWKEN